MTEVETIYHSGNGDGSITIERKQDCQPVLDSIKLIKDTTDGRSISGELYHVARIPYAIIEKYLNEAGVTWADFQRDDVHITRLMNDSDYKHLRVWEGAV